MLLSLALVANAVVLLRRAGEPDGDRRARRRVDRRPAASRGRWPP